MEKWFLWKRFQFLNVCSDTPWIFFQLMTLNNSSGWVKDTQTTAFFKKLETILGKIFEFISVFEVGFPNSFVLVQKIWTLQHILEKKISFINTKHRGTTSKVGRVGGLLSFFWNWKKVSRFWKKCSDCICLWVKFLILNAVSRVAIICCRWDVYGSALIPRNLLYPKKVFFLKKIFHKKWHEKVLGDVHIITKAIEIYRKCLASQKFLVNC